MIQEDSVILDHKRLTSRYFKLTLSSKYISSHAAPGQFVNVRVSENTAPLLRRPFSIHRADPAKQIIEILYEIVGHGTELLSQKKIGESLNILGPLGNGFNIGQNHNKTAILVGGGMGIAPLLFLAEALKNKIETIYVLIGGKNAESVLCEDRFRQLGAEVSSATEDGSHGKKGLVSDVLLGLISIQLTAIYACGPYAMLKAIAEIAFQKKIECYVSMESYMACGIGACKGCPIKTKGGYKMVCKDGPVFDASEIVWLSACDNHYRLLANQ